MAGPLIDCPPSVKEALVEALGIERAFGRLYQGIGSGAQEVFVKNAFDPSLPKKALKTNQAAMVGIRERWFDPIRVKNLSLVSEHHAACVATKVAAIFGLGFIMDQADGTASTAATSPVDRLESEVDTVLDPLCQISWNDVIVSVGNDYVETGEGFIEVRRESGKITGLYYLATENVRIVIENEDLDFHYEYVGGETGAVTRFARFGELELFKARMGQEGANTSSEVIHIRRPNNRDRWYGCPDWISAVPCLELLQALHQFKHDFFLNRGVPEFMLFLYGAKLEKADWDKIESSIRSCIGQGNTHKTVALNITNPNIKIQLEKLALENPGEDTFEKTKESLALSIVTAHRVPPLLAGILIPGKLGATNELPNALRAFQVLVASQEQRTVFQTLAGTLGNPELSGLPLTRENFKPYSILDEIDVVAMDTSSRMRQTEGAAAAQGRDLSQGVKS